MYWSTRYLWGSRVIFANSGGVCQSGVIKTPDPSKVNSRIWSESAHYEANMAKPPLFSHFNEVSSAVPFRELGRWRLNLAGQARPQPKQNSWDMISSGSSLCWMVLHRSAWWKGAGKQMSSYESQHRSCRCIADPVFWLSLWFYEEKKKSVYVVLLETAACWQPV